MEGRGDLGGSMHPQQIEQIPPFKSPSASPPTPLLLAWRRAKTFPTSSVPPPLFFVLFSFSSLSLYSSSSRLSFVPTPQRFRIPIVPSTFEICEETRREGDRGDTVRRAETLATRQYSSQPKHLG